MCLGRLLCLQQCLLGSLVLGDVLAGADHAYRVSGLIVDHLGNLADMEDRAVRVHHAVLDGKALAALGGGERVEHAAGVVGMHASKEDVDMRLDLAGPIAEDEIGRAHVRTPVTNAQLVCRLRLEKKKQNIQKIKNTRI